ncbi:MAG: FAD-dependent oxidoreductase [Lachnospiraceae bacterium]|nr:FAD-dependent oxidoreductase [Lachnospiraceae bacterium]
MVKEHVLHQNEMNVKTSKFLDKFVKRVKANPPGVCPIAVQLSFLQSARSQTCGKCVPCRDGLLEVENMMRDILDGKAEMDTFENMVDLCHTIEDTADCAIGYEAANIVLKSVEEFYDEYMSHIKSHRCQAEVGQKVPCISFCPANVNIPGYIALIGEHRYADAINLIRHDNPFPTACAFICEHPCEEKCRRDLLDSPINIRGLKKFAVDQIAADEVKVPECNVSTGKKVAIVGGGPSGLTTAYFLSLMGHKVVVYEERDHLGGMLRYGIPNYRLPKDRLDQDINAILSTGNIEVKYNVAIGDGKDITMEQLLEDYNAVYVAIGAQTGKSVDVEGVDANGVYSAVDMLGEIGRGNIPDYSGKRVVVVGGGNVAMDCARSAVRCKAKEVTVIYRRRQIDMTALPSEIQGAIEEGVELLTLNAPVKINKDENNNVSGFVCQPQIISTYRGGKPSVTKANKEEFEVPCEIVLMAIGQDIVSAPFEKYSVNERRKTFETEPTTRVKGYDKVFAGGDCVFGPATVIKAIGAGKIAALNIDEYLGYHHKYLDDIQIPEPKENDRTHYGRVHLTDRSARERRCNFDPVENGMSFDEAMQECRKCLRCDHFGCGVLEGGRS